jgi:hypothetical protein
MEFSTLREKFKSRKFLFSIFAFLSISTLLYLDKLPPGNYEGVAISIIVSYLGSNVAYKYVDSKSRKEEEPTGDDNSKYREKGPALQEE